ncbi:MAG: DNA polymerase III subunit beta [Clostridia bacterium]|nr:DNA polymerase III subunit beta [Clostridia bacterium]
MKLTVDTQELNAVLAVASKALSAKSTVSILEGIYMAAENGELLLRCTDLSLQIEATIGANVEKGGACVLPGRLFADLARKLPGEETSFALEKTSMLVESGRATTTMQTENAKDYISMPDVHKEFSVTISKPALKNMIRQSIFATAQDDSKPILRGVLLELEDDMLSMVALDGYRLARRRERVKVSGEFRNSVLPSRGLLEISRILDDNDEDINLIFSRTHVMIDMGCTRIITRLMDGEFIRYRQILPTGHTTRVRANRQELLDSIDRVSLMARESKKNHVKFSFEEKTLTITANSEIGNSREIIATDRVGSDLDIAFNAKYFSDVLKVLDDEYVTLEMNSNISPCVVAPENGSEYYYLILPVRLFTAS